MALYPLFADLRERQVLVVGGGVVATRKVEGLLRAGARVRVGAPELHPELAQMAANARIEHFPGSFQTDWFDGAVLAIAATDDRSINTAVAAEARRRGVLVNVVDDPELCAFHVPAVLERGAISIAISSGGSAPVLARLLRARLESLLDPHLATLSQLLERCRSRLRAVLPNTLQRRRWYESVLDSRLLHPGAQPEPPAEQELLEHATRFASSEGYAGRVTLVGAGPGSAELLTLAGLRALQSADVVLHDRLVGAEVLTLARRDAELIPVGKCGGGVSVPQDAIHTLMLEHAQAGKHVVRLKGGDPFVFGRGGEELEFLRGHGIDYSVVPGVTAALACAAYAGIPLTHREHAQSLRLLTAHCAQSIDTLDWMALAQERQTLAIYMGVAGLERIQARLLLHGRRADTPVALIENGGRSEQRVLLGDLTGLVALARQHQLQSPALLVIGEVAALGQQLHWYGAPPLRPVEASAVDSARVRRPVGSRSAYRSIGTAPKQIAPAAPLRD